jgi:hypothetical protein
MVKKELKVKKSGGGDISITIENNLKTNQTVPQPKVEKRKRKRKTNITNSQIEDMLKGGASQPLPPLKNVSYIKPPSDSFNVWRDTIDSYNTTIPINQAQQMGLITAPPPPAPALPPPPPANNTFNVGNSEGGSGPSWRDFSMFMAAMAQNRGIQAPTNTNWNNIIDDYEDDDNNNVNFAFPPAAPGTDIQEIVDQELIIPENVIEQIPNITEDQTRELRDRNFKITAKRQGTTHGSKGIPQQGQYKDMDEYKQAYEKALVKFKLEQEREKVSKKEMYEAGKKAASKGKQLKYNRNKTDPDFLKGYNDYLDSLTAGMDLPAAAGA